MNPAATSKAVRPKPTATSAYLNPLVPYAAFGYLPKGYALDVTPSAIHDGFLSTVDNLTITAAQPAGDYFIQLSVMPKGGCSGLLGGIPGWSATLAKINRCSTLTGQDSGRAPDVNGRIAYWGNGGLDLAWQYAPDSWAVLQAQSGGNEMFSYLQAQTLLPRMAASVKFGQTKAIVFPFKLPGAVPAGWRPVSATYTVSAAGEYLANELDVAPYADYEARGVTGLSGRRGRDGGRQRQHVRREVRRHSERAPMSCCSTRPAAWRGGYGRPSWRLARSRRRTPRRPAMTRRPVPRGRTRDCTFSPT